VELELVALDRPPQPCGQRQALQRIGRLGAVDGDAAARGLRLVHRGVRVLDQRRGPVGVAREDADADAGVDQQLGGAERERHRQQVAHALPDDLGLGARQQRQAAQEHEELVAAAAREQVARAHGAAQAGGDLAQQAVAHVVPERVVDALEVVEIDVGERDRGAADARLGHGLGQRGVHRGAIRQPRQGIVIRQVFELHRSGRSAELSRTSAPRVSPSGCPAPGRADDPARR
jgi:hypothetical protein